MTAAHTSIQYIQFSSSGSKPTDGKSITEASVSLTVNGVEWFAFMCTPVDLEALAIGFLFNEGVINQADEVATLRVCDRQDNVDVWLNHAATRPQHWRRTSGCAGGMTGVDQEAQNEPAQPLPTQNAAPVKPFVRDWTCSLLRRSTA